jgi:ABC-type sugar transport system ATPase subunit
LSVDCLKAQPLFNLENIVKDFTGVRALDGISLTLYPGEIHCVVGENGAGKSTLMKILSGALSPTSGCIRAGETVFYSLTPLLSKKLGISIVYQENELARSMSAVENIYIGEEISRSLGFVDARAMRSRVFKCMEEYRISIDIDRKVEDLSVSDQQFVKILKALSFEPRALIMDEPTSMFNITDAHKVLDLARNISSRGIGIIYISHFLTEVVEIADRITVIRDGVFVRCYDNAGRDTSLESITRDMVGRPVELFFTKKKVPLGETVFDVKNLRIAKGSPALNFSLRRGEILGFSGMVGSGRTEIMQAIFGAVPYYEGDIFINNKRVSINKPEDSIGYGIAFITEDRQRLGLMLHISVAENIILTGLKKLKGFFIKPKKNAALVGPLVRDLQIKTPTLETEVIYLSGGNQQKVVLAKWLYTDQEIYILDEPTRGIDANAKTEFYKLMSSLTENGKSILLVSSDMPELISMSDRVLVIRHGAVTDELEGENINEHEIVKRALGVDV